MKTALSWLRAFGMFWYRFVIGDDWMGAAGVLILVGGSWLLLRSNIPAWWFGPVVIVITATTLVARGLRRASRTAD